MSVAEKKREAPLPGGLPLFFYFRKNALFIKEPEAMTEQRWLTAKQAAHYCGYSSVSYFLKLVRKYNIPKYGPKKNRFDKFDLDEWMRNPDIFISPSGRQRIRRTFKPVKVF